MKRDAAFPYILADEFLTWWKDMGEPDIRSAFHYWADRGQIQRRRRDSVWRRVSEARRVPPRSSRAAPRDLNARG